MCVVGLVGVTALRSCDACHLRWHLRLNDSAANVVGLLLDLVMVATQGALIGSTVEISVGSLVSGACICMERVFVCCHQYGVWECLLVPAPLELVACCKNGLG